MKYKSVDEIETLSLRDATIVRCIYSGRQGILEFELDGAVVRENNSANELYTDRYVSDMQIRFIEPDIEAVLLEGHKYYDANDVLQESVPDTPVEPENYETVFKNFGNCVIFYAGQPKSGDVDPDIQNRYAGKKCFQMIVDVEEDSYVLSFYYSSVDAQWEHFLNKKFDQ